MSNASDIEMWPSICEATESEWNMISIAPESPLTDTNSPRRQRSDSFHRRSVSVPLLSQYDLCDTLSSTSSSDDQEKHADDDTSAETSSGVDVSEMLKDDMSDFTVLSTPTPSSQKTVKRVSSFKDAILLNAEETLKEKKNQIGKKKPLLSPRRNGNWTPKLKVETVTKPLCRRNSQSMLDLRSLDHHNDGEENFCDNFEAGGYYARKNHGATQHCNSEKLRPDEAKRKTLIIQKKRMQRVRAA